MSKLSIEPIQDYYFAYYRNIITPIAISPLRELVVEYMESHRFVKPGKYIIRKERFRQGEILLDYQDSLIENYENWYLPMIDIEMIKLCQRDLERDIDEIVEGLKAVLLVTQAVKKIPVSDKDTILRAMQIINGFKKKKKIWNKMVDEYKLTDLIFMKMDEYWNRRIIYKERKEARERWMYAIEENDEVEMRDRL